MWSFSTDFQVQRTLMLFVSLWTSIVPKTIPKLKFKIHIFKIGTLILFPINRYYGIEERRISVFWRHILLNSRNQNSRRENLEKLIPMKSWSPTSLNWSSMVEFHPQGSFVLVCCPKKREHFFHFDIFYGCVKRKIQT